MRTKKNNQKANADSIRIAATTLILAEGTTTSLEVKKYLRKQGYWAFQHEVSDLMFRIAQIDNWLCYDNGIFRIYTFPQMQLFPQ